MTSIREPKVFVIIILGPFSRTIGVLLGHNIYWRYDRTHTTPRATTTRRRPGLFIHTIIAVATLPLLFYTPPATSALYIIHPSGSSLAYRSRLFCIGGLDTLLIIKETETR
jgi:hypothetical protein